MKIHRVRQERLLPILVNRTAIFFFLMCLLTIFIYASGTVQDFIDTTQLFLLRLYVVLGVFLVITSAFGMLLDLLRFARLKKPRYLLRAGGYIFLAIFGVGTVLAVLFIITLSEGNRVI